MTKTTKQKEITIKQKKIIFVIFVCAFFIIPITLIIYFKGKTPLFGYGFSVFCVLFFIVSFLLWKKVFENKE